MKEQLQPAASNERRATGKKKRGRDVSGVLLLNKPAGITSNDALQIVKRLYHAGKAGHTGSLDRPATGMLPICLGEATKFTSYLLNADKYYLARCRLGVVTTTGDADGTVVATHAVPPLIMEDLAEVIRMFEGDIDQVPPMHSALKHKGQRLYKLAYQGIEVPREPRQVTIHSIRLLRYEADQFEITVHCSKGTYIRTLVEDIGAKLGCGAHITSLSRTGVGPFRESGMTTLDELAALSERGFEFMDRLLLPVDTVIQEMPEVILSRAVSLYLGQGQAVSVPHAPTRGMLRIYNENHHFLGIGEVLDDGRIAPRKLVNL